MLLLILKSTRGCYFVAIDSELDAAPRNEPATGDEYPTADLVQLDPNNANAALAAVLTPTRITTQNNFAAFMIIMSSLSTNIQRALAARTDVAAEAMRNLMQQYGVVAGVMEFASFQAIYSTVIGMDEALTAYLIRCQDMYAQIPVNNGVSNMSQATFHKVAVKGLLPRTEFAGFINSYHNSHFPDFLTLSTTLMHFSQCLMWTNLLLLFPMLTLACCNIPPVLHKRHQRYAHRFALPAPDPLPVSDPQPVPDQGDNEFDNLPDLVPLHIILAALRTLPQQNPMPAVAYAIPLVEENADGWGPSTVPEHLKDVPFAPFGKGDKLGKASDWTQAAYQKYSGRYQQGQASGTPVFNFFASEEEESFHLVDNRPVKTNKFGGGRGRFQQQRFNQQRRDRELGKNAQGEDKKINKQQQNKGRPWQPWNRDQQRTTTLASSVEVKPEWAVIEQIPFLSLAKLNCKVGEPDDVVCAGELEFYDKTYDRTTVKLETSLQKTSRAFRNVTTSDDPIIKRLAAENKAKVFASDNILTTLMCVKSSVYSWDIIVTKVNGKLFFDRREDSNLNLLTVNETAPETVESEKDSVHQLSLEATAINQNFSQQVLSKSGNKHKFADPNPFGSPEDDEELASCAYKYRKWTLNEEGEVDIIVRCELDGAMLSAKGEEQLLSIKALNETDMKAQDWRKKIESQRGAVLAFETKNNKNKMARWTAAALLSGADMIKLGYVSRILPRDQGNHVILGTQVCKPKDFAGQINLSMEHCWGIVRALVDMILRLDDGKFLLMKDPNKELLRVYAVPDDAFRSNYEDDTAPATEAAPTEGTSFATSFASKG
eukprot:gene17542-23863_t